jgi:type II secretory ATPase GspE/PulE/Tfp pilus assembly ATPase PilB-like protein/nucleotide-binding universal stress UspA family protein
MATIQRILVPTDFSDMTRATLERARKLAAPTKAELHLLYVMPGSTMPLPVGEDLERKAQSLRERLERLAQPAALDGLPIVCAARPGRPWTEIVAYAREYNADLIVMGTHGRTGLAHAVMGSVAEQVIRHAPCPVLVVRPPSEGEAEGEAYPTTVAEVPEKSTPEAAQAEAEALAGAVAEREWRSLALDKLRVQFGQILEGDRHETWERMVYLLGRELHLEPPEAGRLLSDLESAHAITWRGAYEAEDETESQIAHWILGPGIPGREPTETEIEVLDKEEPIPPATIDLLQRALVSRATDIHIDPTSNGRYEVRFRIDGKLEHYCDLDPGVATPLLQQYKVMASLDIAEPFEPKEGRLDLPKSLENVEVRITTSPVQGGTAVALRLLQRDRIVMPLDSLGLSPTTRAALESMLRHGDGLVLITGPTNSGKTTTIYSLLGHISGGDRSRNMVSIEDPIEFPLPFIRQVGVDPRHNLTMTRGLRTVLRMDPDIVFLSEIRDVEAAEIAMRAASSGRFVFTTLHTRDVASTVTALRDLRIDNCSLGGNLTGLISQRLVRRLCPLCHVHSPTKPTEAEIFRAEGIEPPEQLARPVGCDHCRHTGYFDRIGIFEAVVAHGRIGEALSAGAAEEEFRSEIRKAGVPSLVADALLKARDGIVSLEEVRSMKWV